MQTSLLPCYYNRTERVHNLETRPFRMLLSRKLEPLTLGPRTMCSCVQTSRNCRLRAISVVHECTDVWSLQQVKVIHSTVPSSPPPNISSSIIDYVKRNSVAFSSGSTHSECREWHATDPFTSQLRPHVSSKLLLDGLQLHPVATRLRVTFCDAAPAPHSPLVTRRAKRPRTPFPLADEDEERCGTTFVDAGARKRSRKGSVSTDRKTSRLGRPGRVHADEALFPFAQWLATYLNEILTIRDPTSPQLLMGPSEEILTASRILHILLGYYPPRRHFDSKYDLSDSSLLLTVAFLAIWYLTRLFPGGLLTPRDLHQSNFPEVVIRVFLLGLTLANKWLDDISRPNKHWLSFCTLRMTSINIAERAALEILDYNIAIAQCEWQAWLMELKTVTSKSRFDSRGPITASIALEHVARQKLHCIPCHHHSCHRQPKDPQISSGDQIRWMLIEGLGC